MTESSGLVSLGAVFTVFFVMLGPLKIIGPFAKQTQSRSPNRELQFIHRKHTTMKIARMILTDLGIALLSK